jgi:chemotaxis protein methyltransferase CheR
MDALGLSSFDAYWQGLESHTGDDAEMIELVRLLTNKDTYFFREMRQFDVLRDQILPELLATGRHSLRIWSAGCATGEEPYSLVIALLEYQVRHGVFEVEVIGTDIDSHALVAARKASYSGRAVRRVPDDLLQKYFSFDGQSYHLVPEAAELVTFEVHNLVDNQSPSDLENPDIIFCRNVTCYLAEWAQDRVNALLADSLRQGGSLFVASAETMSHNLGRLNLVSVGQTPFFQKQKPSAIAPAPVSAEPPFRPPPSILAQLKPDEQFPAQGSQPGSPSTKRGRPARASRQQSSDLGPTAEDARRSIPPSLEELVARARARARAWSQGADSRPAHEEVQAGSRDPAQDRVILEQAHRAFQKQEYDVALSELDQLPVDVPIWTEAYCLKSAILIRQEQFEEAEFACQTMLAHDPWYADAHFMLGLVFYQQGQVDEAHRSLVQAIDLEPDHRLAHFYLAEIHRGQGQWTEAWSEYESTLDILRRSDEPSPVLNLVGLDDDSLRRACEAGLETLASGRNRN